MTYKKILLNLLDKWAKNEITEIDILEETEVLLEQTTWIEFKENNPQSIIFDVLSNLEALCTQLIIKEDIPAIIAFLNTPKGKEKKGWKDWKEYWDKIDFKNRQEFLRNHYMAIVDSIFFRRYPTIHVVCSSNTSVSSKISISVISFLAHLSSKLSNIFL